jgi:hypothetical protein
MCYFSVFYSLLRKMNLLNNPYPLDFNYIFNQQNPIPL